MSSRFSTALGSNGLRLRFRIRSSETAVSYLTERLSILIRQAFAFDCHGGSIPDTRCFICINNLITTIHPPRISNPRHLRQVRPNHRLAQLFFPHREALTLSFLLLRINLYCSAPACSQRRTSAQRIQSNPDPVSSWISIGQMPGVEPRRFSIGAGRLQDRRHPHMSPHG